MPELPKDDEKRITGSLGRQLVHSAFSMDHWEYREITGVDRGKDCEFELVENEEFTNKRIHAQVKGTRHIENYETNKEGVFSFSLKVSTVNYALSSSNAFVLFLADANTSIVYYLPIQDYFIAHPKEFDKLEKNSATITLYIPKDNIVSEDDFELQQIAKSIYVDGPSRSLHKI